MKVLEIVIEGRFRKIMRIDSMQFGFMAGRSTTNAIFIVHQLQKKYLAKSKDLWMAVVDLEKAFDMVPREVVWSALRYLGVDSSISSSSSSSSSSIGNLQGLSLDMDPQKRSELLRSP